MRYRRCAPTAAVLMLLGLVLLSSPDLALAQSVGGNGSLPWDTFTQRLACMLSGAWVKWVAVIAIAIGGVMYGLGELSGPFSRVMQIGGGFSVAAGAVTVAGWLLGAGTGSCA
jgi:type IV secretion system protein VirB2